MRGNWGMNSWKIIVNARCAGSLQVGLLERKVHATTARQRALQHWDFGTPRISFPSHVQTKGIQQRPPPEKSLKLASCQKRPVASLFWQRFCSYPKCILDKGGVKTYGVAGISVAGGKRMVENCVPWAQLGGGGVNVWSKEGGGNVPKFWSPEIKNRSHPEPRESSTIACTELCFAPGWLW